MLAHECECRAARWLDGESACRLTIDRSAVLREWPELHRPRRNSLGSVSLLSWPDVARLFFAVNVSAEVASEVEAEKARVRRMIADDCLRFTDPKQSHVTLRFLGTQSPERQEAALRAGRRAAAHGKTFDLIL